MMERGQSQKSWYWPIGIDIFQDFQKLPDAFKSPAFWICSPRDLEMAFPAHCGSSEFGPSRFGPETEETSQRSSSCRCTAYRKRAWLHLALWMNDTRTLFGSIYIEYIYIYIYIYSISFVQLIIVVYIYTVYTSILLIYIVYIVMQCNVIFSHRLWQTT